MAQPRLKRTDVHTVSQALGGKYVTEFMQNKVMAVRSFRAFVAVLDNALPTVQLRPMSDSLHDCIVLGIGIPTFVRKDQLRWQGVPSLFQSPQLVDKR